MSESFLRHILAETRNDLERGYLDGLPEERGRDPPSLRAAVEQASSGATALLIEYKRRSPGRPDAPRAPRSLTEFIELARSPAVCGASALACRPEFEGAPKAVSALANALDKPVLYKDFVIDPIQVQAAQRGGAAAILLIARLESEGWIDRPLAELAGDARRRGLEVLVEVHREDELNLARSIGADLYGVNVRDLDTLRLEPEVALRTLRRARSLRPLVLSGISSAQEAGPYVSAGAVGMLVGSAVHSSPDPHRLLSELSAVVPVEAA